MTDITKKNALRRKMRAARKACTDRATRDDCLLQRLMALSVYQKASCVLSYVSFGTEADTLRILDRVLADGKALYVPKCVPNTNRMVFYRISVLRDLSPGAYGILEPKEAEAYQDEANALCLVPGLAFSADGARLGGALEQGDESGAGKGEPGGNHRRCQVPALSQNENPEAASVRVSENFAGGFAAAGFPRACAGVR